MSGSKWKVELLLPGSWRGATSVLISNRRHHIVVDTGLPHEAHQLVAALERRGLKPAHVGTGLNTHFYVGHVLNNTLFPASPLYPTHPSYPLCPGGYSANSLAPHC